MAKLLSENFETTGLSGWSTVVDPNCTINGDYRIPGIRPFGSGSQCLRTQTQNSNNNQAYIYKAVSNQNVNYVRGYIYVSTTLGLNKYFDTLLLLTSGTSRVAVIRVINVSGQLGLRFRYYSEGMTKATGYCPIDYRKWYRVEYKYDRNALQYECRVYNTVNGSKLWSTSGALIETTAVAYYFVAGIYNSITTTETVLYSDMVAWDNATWVGDEREDLRRSSFTTLPYTVYPVPDGTISKPDRTQASHLYSGLQRDIGFYTYRPNVYLDAILTYSITANIDIDSILRLTKTPYATLDALLRGVGTKLLEVDSILSLLKDFGIDLNSTLKALAQLHNVELDARLFRTGFGDENKRRSSFSVLPYVVMPLPDGVVGALDRLQAAYLYSGISIHTIMKTLSKLIDIDSVLRSVGRQRELYTDSILKKLKSQTIDLDSFLTFVKHRLLDIDTIFKKLKTSNIDLDALLFVSGALQISIDALLAEPRDYIIFKRPYDGRLFVFPVPPYVKLSVVLKEFVYTEEVEIDSVLRLTKDVGIDLNAFLYFARTKDIDLDAVLRAFLTTQTNLDSVLKSSKTLVAFIDGILFASKAKTLDLDAILHLIEGMRRYLDVDAILRLTKTAGVDLDTFLRLGKTLGADLDTVLRLLQTKSIDADTILRLAKTKSIDLDGFFSLLRTKTADLDAIIRAIETIKPVELNAVFKTLAYLRTVGLDAFFDILRTKEVDLDSVFRIAKTNAIGVDTILSRVYIFGANISLDTILRLSKLTTVELDAILLLSSLSNVELDAILKLIKTKDIDLEAILRLTKLNTVDLDAMLTILRTSEAYLDAILKISKTLGVDLDTVLTNMIRYTRTLNLDAIISEVARYGKYVSLDTILQALRIKTADLDAIIRAIEKTSTIELTALMGIVRTATLDLDSILRILQTKYTSLDTILRATNLRLVNLDSIMKLAKMFNISLDGVVTEFGVKYAIVSVDAVVRKLRESIHTMVAHSVRTIVSKGF